MLASSLVQDIVDTAARERMVGMQTIMQREAEFASSLQAQLTGIGLDPIARDMANRVIDAGFQSNRLYGSLPLASADGNRIPELVIGSGFHAATYVATRVQLGKPAPVVFESNDFVGGAFAIRSADGTYPGVFNLNSRNRRGNPGLSGDNEAQLNYLPGAPIQASSLGAAEYQSNADMAFIVRLTLAQYASGNVFPGSKVLGVEPVGTDGFRVTYERNGSERIVRADRVIDARGLGTAKADTVANGANVVTFQQFMQRLSGLWPLRGLRNVAVVGGGDSGRCAVEGLLGLGPDGFMSAAGLDTVNRVDWFASGVQSDYESYCAANRGRYRAIGRYLRPDKMGNQRLTVFNGQRRITPVALPSGPALVNGRSYDLVVMATGNTPDDIEGLGGYYDPLYVTPDDSRRVVATYNEDDTAYDALDRKRLRIGPRAGILFDSDERTQGVADIENNLVAMFRLSTRTAATAVRLP